MRTLVGVLVLFVVLSGAPVTGEVSKYARLGTLTCSTEGATRLASTIIKNISCTFQRNGSGANVIYFGNITRRDPDFRLTRKTIFVWDVWAHKEKSKNTSLIGKYFNLGVDFSSLPNVGENALIGGAEKAILLDPVILSEAKGASYAIFDIAKLELRPARI